MKVLIFIWLLLLLLIFIIYYYYYLLFIYLFINLFIIIIIYLLLLLSFIIYYYYYNSKFNVNMIKSMIFFLNTYIFIMNWKYNNLIIFFYFILILTKLLLLQLIKYSFFFLIFFSLFISKLIFIEFKLSINCTYCLFLALIVLSNWSVYQSSLFYKRTSRQIWRGNKIWIRKLKY